MDGVIKSDHPIKDADEYQKDSLNAMINNPKSLEDLEDQWNKYNSMHRKKKRESDWKSTELFGKTNEERYNEYKSNFLKKDIPDAQIEEAYILEDSQEEVLTRHREKIKHFAKETGEPKIARLAFDDDGYSYQTIYPNEKVRNKVDVKKYINYNTYLISDIHIGKNLEHDVDTARKLSYIKENDVILFLGDIGYLKVACKDLIRDFFKKHIKCKNMFLVLGNHDCYDLDFYYSLGIKGIYSRIVVEDKKWVFSHQPWDGPDPSYINFHGHIHNDTGYYTVIQELDNKINCWEGYCPHRFRTLKEWLVLNKIKPEDKQYTESNLFASDDIDILFNDDVEDYVAEEIELKDKDWMDKEISYPKENIEKARYWSVVAIRPMVYPVSTLEELEELWNGYESSIRKHKREADWKSMELFGVDCKAHYEYLKSKFLEKDIPNELEDLSDTVTGSETEENTGSLFEAAEDDMGTPVDNDIEYFKDNIAFATTVPDKILPYYDSKEIEYLMPDESIKPDEILKDLGLHSADFSIKEWSKSYREFCDGYADYSCDSKWKHTVSRLSSMMQRDPNNVKVESALLSLGWNPSIPFNEANSHIGSIRYANKNAYEIVNEDYTLISEGKKVSQVLEPVYIVLSQGKSIFSKAIIMKTKGPFSHAAIGLDSSLEDLYSYNMNGSNGLSPESINRMNKDTLIGVFAIFVNKEDKNKIREVLDYFIENREKTHYSFLNIASFAAGIPLERQYAMICSQFVDSVLKLVNIDITGKSSSLVSPNDFMYKAKTNNKIYQLYEGLAGQYNKAKIDKDIKALRKSAKYIREAKDLPVYFDKDGNLLIKNMRKLDLNEEYRNSHKLLLQYNKTGNIEGMKYELAKLWFLNSLLVRKIEDAKNPEEKKIYVDCNARVLNDFYKYLEVVNKADRDFNFQEYYDSTPFSDAVYKVRNSSINYTVKTIKDLMRY